MKPFSIIKSEAGRLVGDTSSSVLTKIGEAINRKYQELWNLYNWKDITIINESITLTSGAIEQRLPEGIGTIFSITERTNDVVLTSASPYIYSQKYIDSIETNNLPIAYTTAGWTSLSTDIPADSAITIVGGSTSDTTQTVRLYGTLAATAGTEATEQISLNGTTPVAGTVTYDSASKLRIYKSALTEGWIQVYDTESSTTLCYIPARQYSTIYPLIHLQSPPDIAYTAYVSGKKIFKALDYDEDCPMFPAGAALVHYGAASIHATRGNTVQMQSETVEGDRILASLITDRDVNDEMSNDTYPVINAIESDIPILGR